MSKKEEKKELSEGASEEFKSVDSVTSVEGKEDASPIASSSSVGVPKSGITFSRKSGDIAEDEESSPEETPAKPQRVKKLAKTKSEQSSLDSESSTIEVAEKKKSNASRPKTHESISQSSDMEYAYRLKKSASVSSKLHTNLQSGDVFIYVIVPPDGGYGWIIMIISFLCQVIVDGLVFSIGIVMPNMAEDLGVSASQIVLVVSIQIGCYFLSGPISSACINKYGFRPVALFGAAISSTSIAIATFSPNLPMLIVFYSIIGGPTLSMIWVSSQLIIGYYFEKLRPVANGLSCSGAGAGILLASALNSAVIDDLGWRNTLRIHVALLATILLMALTYIEVAPTRMGRVSEDDHDTETDESENVEYLRTHRYSKTLSIHTGSLESTKSTPHHETNQMLVEYKSKSGGLCERCCCGKCTRREDNLGTKGYVLRNDLMERQDVYYTGPANYETSQGRPTIVNGRQIHLDPRAPSINYTLSVMHAAHPMEDRRRTLAVLKQTKRCPCLAYISPTNWLPPKMTNAFKLLFDFRLLAMAEFQILLASAFFFPMGFNIPFVYSMVRAEIPANYAKLISPAIGFSNFAFRIISGFIAYKYKASTTYVCGGGLMFGGVAAFVSAFYGADVIWFQFVYATCYGVAPALYSTLRAIIYVKALGLDKLTNAFGLTAMSMGLGVFVGTTLAGILNQATQSYSASFAFSGCCMMLAGLLKILLPSFIQWKESMLVRSRHVTFIP